MSWSYGTWRATVPLPFGVSWLVALDAEVRAGDPVARGSIYRSTRRIDGARALACSPENVRGLLRVRVGEDIRAGSIVARSGRRVARAIVAAEAGRLVHLDAAGVLHVGNVRAEWEARAPIDGVVRRADHAQVEVEGASWRVDGLAAYGPSRAGQLVRAVDAPEERLDPARLDVALSRRIVLGGASASGEALTRAHAIGAAGVVAASASFRALVPVYGADVSAFGSPSDEDEPTLLVLERFGPAAFDPELFARLAALEGAPAAIDARAASLHVFAPSDASAPLA